MKTNPNSSTVSGEAHRLAQQFPDSSKHKVLQQRLGTVAEVHPVLPMVKVEYANGVQAAGGSFIGVSHSVLDILQRFGKLRNGLRVMVSFINEQDGSATCEIIGIEDEKLGSELQQENSVTTPVYEIFTPGS